MSEAPRRSARNAGKPAAPAAAPKPAAKPAVAKRKADTDADGEKKPKAKASGVLKVGDPLPALTLKTDEGKDISTADLSDAVIFTYPKANTGGCTTQAKLFRDTHDEFVAAKYAVYGLSNDSPTSLANWKAKQNFRYTLISDPQRELIKHLTGAADKTRRSHFVVKAGKLAMSEVSVKPAESAPASLAFVQNN
ncbi:casein kinase II, beta subunit [Moesziomyces antarcticus T-34]|uniref:thioredoxin-dependent peroxiredoxin n=1 Tax=Pseudozyma antarctica (strain T-34) TaxID=1151754 RepID=M9LT22_PSEA3|nr:casein kinase II, beta subunit [Moesziomyces antarcticus T-34]